MRARARAQKVAIEKMVKFTEIPCRIYSDTLEEFEKKISAFIQRQTCLITKKAETRTMNSSVRSEGDYGIFCARACAVCGRLPLPAPTPAPCAAGLSVSLSLIMAPQLTTWKTGHGPPQSASNIRLRLGLGPLLRMGLGFGAQISADA